MDVPQDLLQHELGLAVGVQDAHTSWGRLRDGWQGGAVHSGRGGERCWSRGGGVVEVG